MLKRARRLAAAGDMLIFVHLPLGLNGKLRSHFQGLTKQQAHAILGTLMDDLEWDDKRLQSKYDECVSGAVVR